MAFCPTCGSEVAEGAKFCNACGKPMPVPTIPTQAPAAQAPQPYAQPPPQYGPPPQQGYPQYQQPYPQQPYGAPPYPQPYAYPMYPAPPVKTGLPVAAGALLIVAGILGTIDWVLILLVGSVAFAILPGFGQILLVCGAIGITFSIIALLGGVMAVQRKMWGLALVGSILGLFTIGFVGEASLLSLIAMILLLVCHKEFA